MHTTVGQCSPDGGLMNINISHCEKGPWLLRIYPGNVCNLADYYTLCFGVVFVGRPLLGKVAVVMNFLQWYTICLTVDVWSPNSLEMVL